MLRARLVILLRDNTDLGSSAPLPSRAVTGAQSEQNINSWTRI